MCTQCINIIYCALIRPFILPKVSNDLAYVYSPPTQSGLQTTGREFTADPALISTLSIPPTTFFQLNPDTLRQFVFVTAVDTSHFEELRDCVGSIQQHFPGYHIHLYDLGMTSTQITEVCIKCLYIISV